MHAGVSRHPPLDSATATFSEAPWAESFVAAMRQAPRPVKIISPCVGINAPERAAREMEMPWESCGDYEINRSLGPTLCYLAQDISKVHVGPRTGNIIDVQVADLDLAADGLVSGPPCPPFSDFGRRLVEVDPRTSVFFTVARWILHLAEFGSLSFWIIENVCGIRKRRSGEQSFGDWFIAEMKSAMPHGWEVTFLEHNSIDCCVPQSRPRVFFIGTSGSLRTSPRQRRILSAPLMVRPHVDI